MAEEKYTLNDQIFREGFAAGMEAEAVFPREHSVLVVGGGAAQMHMRETPDLLRPTTDLDFYVDKATGKPERRAWAEHAALAMNRLGHGDAVGKLSRFGSEVRMWEEDPDFLLHLDTCCGNFYERHKEAIIGEFQRALLSDVDETPVRYLSAGDVIIGKIRRIEQLVKKKDVVLDSSEKELLDLAKSGNFDRIERNIDSSWLGEVNRQRRQNVEDLGRFSWDEILEAVQGYKIKKDFYDIVGVARASLGRGEKINVAEFRDALRLWLVA